MAMTYTEAWEIYRRSLKSEEPLSPDDEFIVEEALNLLFKYALPGEEAIMAFNLASHYRRQGHMRTALKYFEYGAEKGDSLCCCMAGEMYYYGSAGIVNCKKAFCYLTVAYESCVYRSYPLLAEMYRDGIYVDRNMGKYEEIMNEFEEHELLNR